MLRSGYLQVASFRGAPIRAHWTLPILCVMWSGLRFAPGAWLGASIVVLCHELGHALLAKHYRLRVVEVMLHGFGGHCAYAGEPTPWQKSVIATGGVLAQAVLLAIAAAAQWLLAASGREVPVLLWDLLYALTVANLGIAMFNLIPIPPFDGAEVWKLPRLWLAARRRQRDVARAKAQVRGQAVARSGRRREAVVAPHASSVDPPAIDEAAVRETVRRALEEARKGSQRPS
jgi:Zn-dependent protease